MLLLLQLWLEDDVNKQTAIEPPASVYTKIAAITGALAKTGIAKSRRNQQQNYSFRGIDEVYSALSPLLAEYRLNILPRMVSREVVERQTQRGGALFYVTVEAEFDFVSADDGTSHTVRTFGEAMDSGDKATNKAMSAAYKYAAFMTFAIPTEGDNDADATTHEVAAREGHSQESAVSPPAKQPAHSKLNTELRGFVHELNGCGDADELNAFLKTKESVRIIKETREKLPHLWDGSDWPEGKDRPEEFVPLADLISKRQRECAEATAQYATQ